MFKSKIWIFGFLTILILSCGKKTKDSENSPNTPPGRDTRDVDLDVLLKNQKVECEDTKICPSDIAKIVISDKQEVKHCTGVLIEEDRILTSASCLPRNLRTRNIDCSGFVFAVFPETDRHKSQSVLCDEILFSDKLQYETFPELWKNDVAVLKIKKSLKNRGRSKLYRKGIDSRNYSIWKVDTITEKLGVIKKERCKAIKGSYLNPFSDDPFSGMFVTTGCDLVEGNAGAPIISNGRVVGLYSKEMSYRIYNYLKSSNVLSEKIGQFYHFSNLSCSTYSKNLFYPHRIPKECLRIKNFALLDRFRASILKDKSIHRNEMRKIEAKLEKPAKYFVWDVIFEVSRNGRSFEAYYSRPKCIYGVRDWIDNFSTWTRRGKRKVKSKATETLEVPHYVLHTKLDKYLRPVSVVESDKIKSYEITFSPSGAYFRKSTNVSLVSSRNGQMIEEDFDKINDKCSSNF